MLDNNYGISCPKVADQHFIGRASSFQRTFLKEFMLKLIHSRLLILLLSSFFTVTTWSAEVKFAPIPDQSIILGAKISVSVNTQVTSDSVIHYSIDLKELTDLVKAGDLSLSIDQNTSSVIIQTRTFAPSFQHKKFALQAKDSEGNLISGADVDLSVLPVFVVNVSDSPNSKLGAPEFRFDSLEGVSYFRPHAGGLQLIFNNKSSQTIAIHGSGAIKHEKDVKAPGQSYIPELILPTAGPDLKGYYTIHGVYTPDRNVIFNATQWTAGK